MWLQVRGKRERQGKREIAGEEGKKEKSKMDENWGGWTVVERKARGPPGSSLTSTSCRYLCSEAAKFHRALKTIFLTGICKFAHSS